MFLPKAVRAAARLWCGLKNTSDDVRLQDLVKSFSAEPVGKLWLYHSDGQLSNTTAEPTKLVPVLSTVSTVALLGGKGLTLPAYSFAIVELKRAAMDKAGWEASSSSWRVREDRHLTVQ